jgi:hypothetical protein
METPMHTNPTTRTRRFRRVLLAALVAGALSGGYAAAPVSATPVGPDEELGVEIDPCNDLLQNCDPDDDGPLIDCDETPQLCELTTPTTDPDDPEDPEDPQDPEVDGSDVVEVNPRFTG